MQINERIKARRQELGLSVDDIAEKLHINRATYYRYESEDIKKFPLDIVLPLAEILKMSPPELMGWDLKSNPTENNGMVEIEKIAKNFSQRQMQRLLEYARMLDIYKDGD